ncbi:MAG: hypothetical protein U9O94_03865 [Nanoarchaeota archaeon]|nr:hypothetical protein [Nanoarchaeota archaeon]
MKNLLLGVLVLLILIFSGCEGVDLGKISDEDLDRLSEKLIECNKPYIRYGGSCCLDQNDNKICDKDENDQSPSLPRKEANDVVSDKTKSEEMSSNEIKDELKEKQYSKYTPPKNIYISDFPFPFIEGNNFNGLIIIGDRASAESAMSANDILMALQYSNSEGESDIIKKIDISSPKLVSEIVDFKEQNVIIIGDPCENKITKEIIGKDGDCKNDLIIGEGVIQLFDTGKENVALLVTGGEPRDTREAAHILSNYKEYSLKGNKCSIKVSSRTINCE